MFVRHSLAGEAFAPPAGAWGGRGAPLAALVPRGLGTGVERLFAFQLRRLDLPHWRWFRLYGARRGFAVAIFQTLERADLQPRFQLALTAYFRR